MSDLLTNEIALVMTIVVVSAWVTNVVVCIYEHAWALLLIGAIIFPIGVIHGVGVWLGVW
jgi:hypothetical protein